MNKNKTIAHFLETTHNFDKSVTSIPNSELFSLHKLELKHAQNLSLLEDDPEIVQICYDLFKTSEKIFRYVSENKHQTIDKTKNTLIFFYKNDSLESKNFIHEWKKIKQLFNDKLNVISVNCGKNTIVHKEICDLAKVKTYPSIKLVEKGKIVDYVGKITFDEIKQTFAK